MSSGCDSIKMALVVINSYNNTKPTVSTAAEKFWLLIRYAVKKYKVVLKYTASVVAVEHITRDFIAGAEDVLANNTVSWTSIVSLYAFSVVLGEKLVDSFCNSDVNVAILEKQFALQVGLYIHCKLGAWIRSQGGWSTLLKSQVQ